MPTSAEPAQPAPKTDKGDGFVRSSFAVREDLWKRMKPFLTDLGIKSPSELLSVILEDPAKCAHYMKPYVDSIMNQEQVRKSAQRRDKEEREILLKKMRSMPLEELKKLETKAQVKAAA